MGKPTEVSHRRLTAETAEVSRDPPSGASRVSGDEPRLYLPGEVIDDRYRLEREIGRGGMGVVWVAHSLVLGVDVALKLIRASETGPEGATRMAREANAAARVGHPALVRVFDFGWTPHGDPFLVMELIKGESLSELITRIKRLPEIRAVQILLPIADGLRVAHERSIVHRDIKPANILVAMDAPGRQQPKLLDFGIAKVGPNIDGKLTQVGTVLGSPEYMSPEQALGIEDVDARTDVWSLCVALYELLTGEVPFKRGNYNALMQAIIHDPPVPTTKLGVGDAALWALIERGLAKNRDERWGDMNQLGRAMARWLYERGIKEDISGNSVRAVWLHEGLLHSLDPKHSSVPAPEHVEPAQTQSSWGSSAFGVGVQGWLRRRPRAGLVAAAVLAAGLAALGVGLLGDGNAKSVQSDPVPAAEPIAAAGKLAAATDAVGPALPAAPATQALSSADPAAGSVASATAEQAQAAASANRGQGGSPRLSASPRRAATGAKRAPLKPVPKSKRDFGF
jgi:eukaryotic-like serine/threonine-protein kinase